MGMDSPRHHKPHSLSASLFFIVLLSTNLLTFFFSTTFYSSCSLTSSVPAATGIITSTDRVPSTTVSRNEFKQSDTTKDLPAEFLAFTSGQSLPFGFNSNFDSDFIFPPVGNGCTRFPDDLHRFMTYPINGSCPDDELLAQKLLLRGCEPLPRRRCRPAAPPNYVEPYPFPMCIWTTPSDNSVVWTAYTCKDYHCLINRKHRQKGFDDCKDCFDLEGREKFRWTATESHGGLDFTIDEVLATKPPGTIRIGLDIGGGVATFAVRMMQMNITIVTTSMNLNGPFNSFIASRGVVPLYISVSLNPDNTPAFPAV